MADRGRLKGKTAQFKLIRKRANILKNSRLYANLKHAASVDILYFSDCPSGPPVVAGMSPKKHFSGEAHG